MNQLTINLQKKEKCCQILSPSKKLLAKLKISRFFIWFVIEFYLIEKDSPSKKFCDFLKNSRISFQEHIPKNMAVVGVSQLRTFKTFMMIQAN